MQSAVATKLNSLMSTPKSITQKNSANRQLENNVDNFCVDEDNNSEEVKKVVNSIVVSYIESIGSDKRKNVVSALQKLLNGKYLKYDLDKSINLVSTAGGDLQRVLSNINEKSAKRKQLGVFYTPEDVARYVVWNSITMLLDKDNERTYKGVDALAFVMKQDREQVDRLLYQATFIDPTCGAGEFVLSVLKVKLDIIEARKEACEEEALINICKTLHGNDIDDCSTDIAKIRIFIEFAKLLKEPKSLCKIASILAKQFTNHDFIVYKNNFVSKFDCVIGNPPYVEYGKFPHKQALQNSYGNVYADAIKNSFAILKNNGVLGFVIPLSYVATGRMGKIRDFVYENSDREFILSFADRPDCLFNGVHQKLNIIVARKSKDEHKLFTSNYRHWYKHERSELLNGCEIKHNTHNTTLFIPKIGNKTEESIYRKIHTATEENIYDRQNEEGQAIYLNMRACFWIKAFSFNPGSKEYKGFNFNEDNYSLMHCILNSSLFWLYWTIVSDCWHITSKELKGFLVPNMENDLLNNFVNLSRQLEEELERTKKYIGTKQTDYEYKHKECKETIDAIDDLLARMYDLTEDELLYVKSFALKYRMGGGANDKSN